MPGTLASIRRSYHRTSQKVLSAVLDKLGIRATLADNGQEAFDAIKAGESAELILMDLDMPRLNGYQATQAIRIWEAQHGQKRRAIIACTASAFEEDRQRGLAAGMDDGLAKPVVLDALKAVLRRRLAADLDRPG